MGLAHTYSMKRLLGAVVLTLGALGPAGCGKQYEMEKYIDANLDKLKARQERVLGIHYDATPAVVVRTAHEVESARGPGTAGFFEPAGYTTMRNGKIVRPPGKITVSEGRTYLPDQNPGDMSLIPAILNSGRAMHLDHVLDHELIHAYNDRIRNTRYPWEIREGRPLPPKTEEEKIAFILVDEGIAEFGTRRLHPGYRYQSAFVCDSQFPVGIELYKEKPSNDQFKGQRLKYTTAFCLAEPVLAEGFADGVLKFAQNPIKPDDLQDLGAYQQRVLRAPVLDEEGKPVRKLKNKSKSR